MIGRTCKRSGTRFSGRQGAFARGSPLLRWSALLALFALVIQSFVVQTHIHMPQGTGKGPTLSLITLAAVALADKPHAAGDTCAASTPRDRYPINEDPVNCPLCQEFSHAGQFVSNVASIAALPVTATFHLIPWFDAPICAFTVTHIWRGRAPPQA